MKNKLSAFLITFFMLALSVLADSGDGFSTEADFTGEAFFRVPVEKPAVSSDDIQSSDEKNQRGTVPPLKVLRLKMQENHRKKMLEKADFAPTMQQEPYQGETETSDFASKEIEEDFDDMTAADIEGNEETAEESKSKKGLFGTKYRTAAPEEDEEMILDCEQVDYDTENHLVYAKGNASMEFVKQGATIKSDIITYDRLNNTIKAEGNVRVYKNGFVTRGDYIFVDLNEENGIMENPITESPSLKIVSDKGMVCGDKIVLEKGTIQVKGSHKINMRSGRKGPRMYEMLLPNEEDMMASPDRGVYKLKARDISYKQKGELEVLSIKRGKISSKATGKTIFKFPAIKLYTNKNHDYGETNFWEIGSYRGLGLFTGPGWVFELPKGSVLKAMPILNYKSGMGGGGMLRFNSGTNQTTAAYGTAAHRFFVYGNQKLDDHLRLQYSVNSYMDEWFMGRRRPKYGVSLVYDKGYAKNSFLIKDHTSTFAHRLEAGYFQDLDFDSHYERIQGHNTGTTRFRYMMQGTQNFFSYRDEEKLRAFELDLTAQLSTSLYGTGDTQIVGRLGPKIHTQYKRWMQDVGYLFSTAHDETPMRAFDAYRYGTQSVYLRESLRLSKWLMVSWFTTVNVSNDAANHRKIQENSFYLSVGPDDFKLHLGYDFERELFRCTFEVMMDAKGTEVEYDKLEIKQDKKAKKENKIVESKPNENLAPVRPRVLQRAVVEDVRVMENVL